MGASNELFRETRELEAFELTETKKSILNKSETFAKSILENGEITKQEAFAKTIRNATFWQNVADTLKPELTEKESFYGVEVTPTNGRKMLQFQEDPIWVVLNSELKQREELLKLAQNQEVLDTSGNEVPKVSVKHSKSSITIKF